MKLLLFIVGLALGYCSGVFRKEIALAIKKWFNKREPPKVEPVTDSRPNPETVPAEAAQPSDYDLSAAIEQFVGVQDKFFGIYESMYEATAQADNPDISDWDARITSLSGCPDLQSLWNAIRLDPSKMMSFLKSCGIERDDRTCIVAQEDTRYKYVEFNGDEIIAGEQYLVIQPYWHNASVVLGKGILRKKD